MKPNDFSPEALPNRFDHAEAQPRWFAVWEQGGYFHADPKKPGTPYSIVIPPPNVTGALHLGHALNNTLQDIQIRMRRMQGRNTLWMPGTDHAGIATQAVVERRLKDDEGKTRHDLGREKLVERIWAWKDQYEARILSQLKRMGCSCDWERTRFTLDPICAKAVRQTFFDLFAKGLIYRGKRLVNWDTFLQTAVSDDEVFQEKVKGKFWHFRYPVIQPKPGEPSHVVIATTRPETMLGDTAVAVHPEPAKALDRAESELRERLAKLSGKERAPLEEQLENIATRRQEMLPHLELLAKMARDGRRLKLPLADREIPLVADEWAKPELGSGCVKITPAHDANDYQVGQRCRLPMINILKEDGTITTIRESDGTVNPHTKKYTGLTITKARAKVVEDLDALGLVGDIEDREIELPHSDRSKTPIEPFLADQWFVKMGDLPSGRPGLAQTAIDAVESARVKIFPERYKSSYVDWLKEKRDWPVSRQLWWGHQIPVWVGKFHEVPADLLRQLEQFAVEYPAQVSWQILDEEIEENNVLKPGKRVLVCLGPEADALAPKLEAWTLVREPDVLDTWFSSALWPHSTLGWPAKTPELAAFYPTSVLITSRDIITLWVARMVLTGLNNMGEVPFREVFIHPKILDRYGDTMAKSKGNGVDPIDVIAKFGADALRFGLAQLTTETQDVKMPVQFECPSCEALTDQTRENRAQPKVACSKCGKPFSTQWAEKPEDKALPKGPVVSERFEVARNFTNKLWNAARFALINLEGYSPGKVDDAALSVEDKWILSRLATVTQTVTESLDRYHYADASKALYDFAWNEFCSFYVEMAKPRLQDAATRPHAQRILAHTLDVLLRLLHPMMPFVTEEIWSLLGIVAPNRGLNPVPASGNLIVASWPAVDAARRDATIEARFGRFQEVLSAIREIRSRQNIHGSETLDFYLQCDDETARLLVPMAPYFASMANARAVGCGPQVAAPPTSAKATLPGIELFVDLKDFIDTEAEIAKNAQQEQKLIGLIKGKEAKLTNESFVSRAPADVVQKERDALAEYQRQLDAVRETLAALRAT